MYFMHLCQGTGDKLASKEQSSWICFTAVKLSTLWTSCRRGNNKRNSWSNYQPDKNALNFKKGSDKRHLQLSQAPGCQGLWIPAVFQLCCQHCQDMATRVIETGSLKTLSLLQTQSLGNTATAGAFLGRGERKRNRKKKNLQSTDIIYPSQEIPMPLQQNAVHIGFISTTKRIVRCFLRNNS